MKIAAMFADGTGGTVDRPDPKAIDDFVVVKIRSVPMCTEYKGFKREREKMIEDRKDQRTRISGTQQSEMISQRKNDTPPTNFTETEDPDGINLSAFNMQ